MDQKKDTRIGTVQKVYLPDRIRPVYRWVVKKRADGRYIVRAPKRGVLIRILNNMNENDFNAEKLLPKNTSFENKTYSESVVHMETVRHQKTKKKAPPRKTKNKSRK